MPRPDERSIDGPFFLRGRTAERAPPGRRRHDGNRRRGLCNNPGRGRLCRRRVRRRGIRSRVTAERRRQAQNRRHDQHSSHVQTPPSSVEHGCLLQARLFIRNVIVLSQEHHFEGRHHPSSRTGPTSMPPTTTDVSGCWMRLPGEIAAGNQPMPAASEIVSIRCAGPGEALRRYRGTLPGAGRRTMAPWRKADRIGQGGSVSARHSAGSERLGLLY
jgi:hypothetical protein